ncbi:unnamed protein product [Ilex paraguariensis]|uniref:SAM domain-containing protein n=1 Tax=Ilex paraguariensis TaxID=185542 RepID=A0ABC8QNN4_9AQUA
MYWYSWLSKTSLDPSLIHKYGLTFTRNELQEEDLTYFNHEFLQSMGIHVAKHRLEILKLASKEVGGSPNARSRLVLVIKKTRRLLTKNIGKWVFHKDSGHMTLSELMPYRTQWTGALRKQNGVTERKQENVMVTNRSIMRSGPLDRKVQEKLMGTNRGLSISGPLDGKVQERLMFTPIDPKLRRIPSDEGVHSLWSLMFQDMKPT